MRVHSSRALSIATVWVLLSCGEPVDVLRDDGVVYRMAMVPPSEAGAQPCFAAAPTSSGDG